jgi:hypothetical protein
LRRLKTKGKSQREGSWQLAFFWRGLAHAEKQAAGVTSSH